MKRWRRALLLVAALVLAYLALAGAWAWMVFDAARAAAPVTADAPLSTRQSTILLRVEDPTFFEHAGLSIAPGQGVATISSALARDLFLGDSRLDGAGGLLQRFYRGVFDCCKRIDLGRDVMSLVLDARMSKQEQLARYVATVYMGTHEGRQVKGLEGAARSYLGKPLAATSEEEFVRLVAMIKAPNGYHPVRSPDALAQRSARIQSLLAGRCAPKGWFDTEFIDCGP
ncbi:transglycosylase domain-containing protein [Massilia sp. IC2-477]|uniref:transglycosylase domain-containing protein n=1 Tax=Massilia sp. IC2-477 TaxID=2887198 RepID=UPI001D12E503|nr:transglycosylase domain-containing protein [Massilia sp. IC2-477]